MTTRIAPDELTQFTRSDETAFERIFREEFGPLTAYATAELDAAGAPRLVEQAFFAAWQQRTRFRAPMELEAFLRETIHKEALREKSRRAQLQRFHEHEGLAATTGAPRNHPTTVDEAWNELVSVLHAPPPDPERAAHMRHDASRHEAAAHVAKIAKKETNVVNILLTLLVGAVVLGGITLGVRYLSARTPPAELLDNALAAREARMQSTRPAVRGNLPLADGSAVALGPETTIRIPAGFNERVRGVRIDGTASITVAPGNRSFLVRAGPAVVTAQGTIIDVSSYASGPVVIRVREGTAEVAVDGEVHSLADGAAVMVDSAGAMSSPSQAVVDEALGWTGGRFVLHEKPLRELPALIQRWYGLQVVVLDTAVQRRTVSIDVSIDSAREMIGAVEAGARVRYAQQGELRVFRNAQ